ncbi:serine hydrolase domain-containing protein [Liquorilactobacillus nagelii]|uniref:serine hydrolase domain-containing protein n=1 Tax=Liquorilactobacillus nagelii TaxID=82688 RepID=UPI0039EA1B4B
MKKGRLLIVLGVLGLLGVFGFLVNNVRQEKEFKNQERITKKSQTNHHQQHHSVKKQETAVATIDRNQQLDQLLQKVGFNGTALIVKNQQIVLRKGYGTANQAQQTANTSQTLFPIASTEKALIATSILQLDQQHRLSVNDPINKYLPGFPNGSQIKLRNFLTHTSGIVGRAEDNQNKSLDQMIAEIEHNGVHRPLGSWQYEDSNYTVLVKVLEKVTHESFKKYLMQHVFKPAGIETVGYVNQNFSGLKNASIGYLKQNNQLTAVTIPNFSQLYGVSDMYMSVTSMYQFDWALKNKKLLDAAHLQLMFTPGSSSHYGMGFYNDPGLIVNRGYVAGWVISNGFTHDGQDYILLFSNVKDKQLSLGKLNSEILQILRK